MGNDERSDGKNSIEDTIDPASLPIVGDYYGSYLEPEEQKNLLHYWEIIKEAAEAYSINPSQYKTDGGLLILVQRQAQTIWNEPVMAAVEEIRNLERRAHKAEAKRNPRCMRA